MVDVASLYSGFQRASRYQPVPTSTLETALKPYSIVLASLRGKSDLALRNLAIQSVLVKNHYPYTPPPIKAPSKTQIR